MLSKAMTDLQSFMTSMPELSEQQLAMLLDSKPGLVARPVAEVGTCKDVGVAGPSAHTYVRVLLRLAAQR